VKSGLLKCSGGNIIHTVAASRLRPCTAFADMKGEAMDILIVSQILLAGFIYFSVSRIWQE
jgi:hypothetical protein